MEQRGVQRKLAAIVAADVAGYSRLMEADEESTLAALKAHRRALVDPKIKEHRGKIIKTTGDGLLLEFASAVDAVRCAVEIQRGMADRNAGVPQQKRIEFRIGINLGDIIHDDNDIFGDGVNVAARLEGLAEPGGICVSQGVRDPVRDKLGFTFEDMGEQALKNISAPVHAYRVRFEGAEPANRTAAAFRRPRPRNAVAASAIGLAAVCAVAVVAVVLWPHRAPPIPVQPVPAVASAPSPLPDKPSIAVLPFANIGHDEATGRLADGITEDIITDLARFHDLDVTARNSTEVYKGHPVDIRQVGRDLSVGYVLEGSIQRQDNNIRVTAQLIDARSDAHVWSNRWDRPAADVFAVQTELAEKVAAALGGNLTMGQITRNELQRAKRLRPTDLTAYGYFLLGEEAKALVSNESIPKGIDYLTRALALDPKLARAYAVRAWLYLFSMMYGGDPKTMLANMVADAERAVQLDPQDAESLATVASAHLMQGRYAEAEAEFRSALEMSPANSHVAVQVAAGFAYMGLADEGAALADRALRLDPRMTPANLSGIKEAYFMTQRYADTIATVNRMPEESRTRDSWLYLAVSYARMGKQKEAVEAKAKLLQAFPDVSAERMLNEDYTFARKQDEEFFIDAFKAIDMPVCAPAEFMAKLISPKPLSACNTNRPKR